MTESSLHFNTENPPPSRHALAHFWGGISAACISAGVLSALLFSEPPGYPGAAFFVFSLMAAVGPAIAFFKYRKPLHLAQQFIELPLKDGSRLTLVCEWFPNPNPDNYLRSTFKVLLDERMVHHPLDTVDPSKVRGWVEQALVGFSIEQKFSVFRVRLTNISDAPRQGPADGIIIGEYDR